MQKLIFLGSLLLILLTFSSTIFARNFCPYSDVKGFFKNVEFFETIYQSNQNRSHVKFKLDGITWTLRSHSYKWDWKRFFNPSYIGDSREYLRLKYWGKKIAESSGHKFYVCNYTLEVTDRKFENFGEGSLQVNVDIYRPIFE